MIKREKLCLWLNLQFFSSLLTVKICFLSIGLFESHTEVNHGRGILIPLPKPCKPRGPVKNIRPVIRKNLSNITLARLANFSERHLSASQCAYRTGKSTTDIVWSYKWITARVQKYRESLHITCIDTSSAFDTIKREHLLDIVIGIPNDDVTSLIQILISKTTLEIKIDGDVEKVPIETNIDSPQGNGLSGTAFDCFFKTHSSMSEKKSRNE